MLIPAIVFVAVALVVFGAYYALLARPEGETQRALERRLTPTPREKFDETVGLLKESERLSDVPALDHLLGALTTVAVPLQRWLSQSGLKWTVGTLLLLAGCAVLLAFMLAVETIGSALVGIPVALGAGYVPFAWVQYKRASRLQQFEEQFPEAIDLLARALRAGHAFTTGLEMVGAEMDDPVGAEFRQMFDSQTFGMPVPDTLRQFAERTPLIDAKFFATAVLTQREAGGNLSEVLDNLSTVIRERFRVKRQVRVVTADKRATGWVLCALPPAIAIALFILNPRQLMILVHDPLGIQMIALAVTLQIVGTLIIRKMVTIEY
jgi:tight adherence protein B